MFYSIWECILLLFLAVFYPLDEGVSHIFLVFSVLCHLVPVKFGCSFDVFITSLLWSASASFFLPRSRSCCFPLQLVVFRATCPAPFFSKLYIGLTITIYSTLVLFLIHSLVLWSLSEFLAFFVLLVFGVSLIYLF